MHTLQNKAKLEQCNILAKTENPEMLPIAENTLKFESSDITDHIDQPAFLEGQLVMSIEALTLSKLTPWNLPERNNQRHSPQFMHKDIYRSMLIIIKT